MAHACGRVRTGTRAHVHAEARGIIDYIYILTAILTVLTAVLAGCYRLVTQVGCVWCALVYRRPYMRMSVHSAAILAYYLPVILTVYCHSGIQGVVSMYTLYALRGLPIWQSTLCDIFCHMPTWQGGTPRGYIWRGVGSGSKPSVLTTKAVPATNHPKNHPACYYSALHWYTTTYNITPKTT